MSSLPPAASSDRFSRKHPSADANVEDEKSVLHIIFEGNMKKGPECTYPLLGCKFDFPVTIHTQGEQTTQEFLTSDIAWSAHHFACVELEQKMADFLDCYAVLPVYRNDNSPFPNKLEVQSMVTGGVHFGEGFCECCERELREEVGLEVESMELVRELGGRYKTTKFYVSTLSAITPSPVRAGESVDDRSKTIACIPIVRDPNAVLVRQRIESTDCDSAGVEVAVIHMKDYIHILREFNRRKM